MTETDPRIDVEVIMEKDASWYEYMLLLAEIELWKKFHPNWNIVQTTPP